jgi:hypothetical protein
MTTRRNSQGESILNDEDNDEGLYMMWRSSGQSKREFIRDNRADITAAIRRVLDAKPKEKTWRDY